MPTDPTPPVIVFTGEITPSGQTGYIEIDAIQGTQSLGFQGSPLDSTDPGPIEISIRDDSTGHVSKIRLDHDYARVAQRTLDAALAAADTRDQRLDKPRTN